MNCEICGNPIRGPPSRIVVEGARLVVCIKCSTYGEDYWQPASPSKAPERPLPRPVKAKPRRPPATPTKESRELELPDDFGARIRKARERLGLTQEDLAKQAKERLSIIQKIELGKMAPNLQLSKTLEHVLRTKLLVPTVEPEPPKSAIAETQELTIGDVIQFKKKDAAKP